MESLFAVKFSWLIPLLPLIGAMVAGFAGARWLKQNSHWPIWIGVGLSALLSFALLFGMLAQRTHETGKESTSIVHEGGSPSVAFTKEARKYPLAANRDWYSWIS